MGKIELDRIVFPVLYTSLVRTRNANINEKRQVHSISDTKY